MIGNNNIRKKLIKLAWPLMLSNLAYVLLGALDTWFMGKVDTLSLGAVGVGSMLFVSLSLILRGTINGGLVFISQSYGRKEYHEAGNYLGKYFFLTLLLAPFALLLPFIAKIYFLITKADVQVAALASSYINIRAIEIPFALISQSVASFLMGIGDSKRPMFLAWSSVVINLFANYVLVFGKLGFPELGLVGAAWGTVIAQVAQTLLSLFVIKTFYTRRFNLKGLIVAPIKEIKEMLRLGIPLGLAEFVETSAFATFMTLLSRLGPIELAASQIANQINGLAFMPGFAIGIATSSLVGRSLGGEDHKKARSYGIEGVKIGILYMAIIGLTYWLFPRYIAGFFTKEQEVIELAIVLLKLISIYQIFDAANIVFKGALNGAGDTQFTGIITVLAGYMLFIPLTYVSAFVLDLGLYGAWIGPMTYLILLGIIFSVRFLSGRYQTSSRTKVKEVTSDSVFSTE